ncbi:universal stress protein [Aeromicrobium wangtongii]|uniref:Universal stress protein n=1 Tax=Aeromicrobium wangtongii TaxID=2969247 RepID=A0ABY5M8X0_9ACTN|nr:universal stress protein [Aeromicrobium wangtongii]MCD9198215.1 universal stress protein [Aeromicrobium wangtongii]UUP12251.1 universal stress protein [Aeromicrobium wangtongii]
MAELAPIVVGIDGGPASVAALEFALREAQLRRTSVEAISCWPATARRDDSSLMQCATQEQAAEVLEHVIDTVQLRHPHTVPIVRTVTQAIPGPALVHASRNSELIVLGSTTRGPYGHHHGRKTIEHCMLYGQGPVAVVPWLAATLDQADIDIDLHQRPSTE